MQIIEKTEISHERMGTVSGVTLAFPKSSNDPDWKELIMDVKEERNSFVRIGKDISMNQVETYFEGREDQSMVPWIITVISQDKARQNFMGVMSKSKDENDLMAFFDE